MRFLNEKIKELMRRLDAYIVGGAVRDFLLGKAPKDIDLITTKSIQEIKKAVEELGGKAVPKGGEKFLVVTAIVGGQEVDIVRARKEVYLPHTRKPVVVPASIKEDVMRRDLTINALLMDADGNVIDYVGGLNDLKNKVIRFVGNPDERISEDPLRALRAVRFAVALGFVIEPKSFSAIRRNAHKLTEKVSWERIRDELVKMFKVSPYKSLKLLDDSGLLGAILWELDESRLVYHDERPPHYGESVLDHTLDALKRFERIKDTLSEDERLTLAFALLLHDIGKRKTVAFEDGKVTFYKHEVVSAEEAFAILKDRLKFPRTFASEVKQIIRAHHMPLTGAPKERIMAKHGKLAKLILLHAYCDTGDERYLREAEEVEELLRRADVAKSVSGKEIMERLGLEPGPLVGKAKRMIVELMLKGYSKEEAFRMVKERLASS